MYILFWKRKKGSKHNRRSVRALNYKYCTLCKIYYSLNNLEVSREHEHD